MVILLELTRCFQGVLVDQGSLRGSRRGTLSTPCLFHCQRISYHLTMNETGPLRGPPSPHVAGANPRSTRSEKYTSAASSQGALVHQDTLKTTRELQKNHHDIQSPRESLKSSIDIINEKFQFSFS
jgi:hypothetical protein